VSIVLLVQCKRDLVVLMRCKLYIQSLKSKPEMAY